MAQAISIEKAEARLAMIKDCLQFPDRQLGAHLDRGPVEYRVIRNRYVAEGEKMAAKLARQIEAAKEERQARGTAAREAKQTVCPVCFCAHPGEC